MQWAIVAGVFAVLTLRRVAPIFGTIAGMLLTGGIALWGYDVYRKGQSLGLGGWELPPWVFWILIALWFLLEIWELTRAIKARRELKSEAPVDDISL